MKKKKADSVLQGLVLKEVQDVKKNLHRYMESSILSIIGLEKEYSGDYSIDHCNGRNSLLIDTFRNLAKEEAEKIAGSYKISKEDLGIFQKQFRDEIMIQMNYALQAYAKVYIKERADILMKEKQGEIDKEIEEYLKKELTD